MKSDFGIDQSVGYESPQVEIIEISLEQMLASSIEDMPIEEW